MMVDPYACHFVSHREIECQEKAVVEGVVEGEEDIKIEVKVEKGILVDESFGVCHHLSYARTEREMGNKFRSFEHSGEVAMEWIDTVFKEWKEVRAGA